MTRSFKLAAVGAVLLFVGLVVLLLALPRFSPFEYWVCNPSQGGTECSSFLNPLYPIAFLSSVGGTIALFFGAFGKSFLLKPIFIIGMVLLEWSVLGLSFGYLGHQWCVSARLPSGCISYHPGFYLPTALGGAALILLQSLMHLRSSKPKKDTRVNRLPLSLASSGESCSLDGDTFRCASTPRVVLVV